MKTITAEVEANTEIGKIINTMAHHVAIAGLLAMQIDELLTPEDMMVKSNYGIISVILGMALSSISVTKGEEHKAREIINSFIELIEKTDPEDIIGENTTVH